METFASIVISKLVLLEVLLWLATVFMKRLLQIRLRALASSRASSRDLVRKLSFLIVFPVSLETFCLNLV